MKKLLIASIIALIGSTNVDAATRTTIALDCLAGTAAITTDGNYTAFSFGDILVTNFKSGSTMTNHKDSDFVVIGVNDGLTDVDVAYKPSNKKIALMNIDNNKQMCLVKSIETKKE